MLLRNSASVHILSSAGATVALKQSKGSWWKSRRNLFIILQVLADICLPSQGFFFWQLPPQISVTSPKLKTSVSIPVL